MVQGGGTYIVHTIVKVGDIGATYVLHSVVQEGISSTYCTTVRKNIYPTYCGIRVGYILHTVLWGERIAGNRKNGFLVIPNHKIIV